MRILNTALSVIFTLYFFNSQACINEFGVTHQGKKILLMDEIQLYFPKAEFDTVEISKNIKELKDKLQKKYTYQTHSDIAVNLLKLGQHIEGLLILEKLNKKHPSNYRICANLGTAYELNGNLDSALFYIKKGIMINSESHAGSEWVHVKILEAKLKLKQDPHWLDTHTVLGIQFDTIHKIKRYSKEEFVNVSDTLLHVKYQLQERIPFSPLPDELVSHLLLELGDMYAYYSIEDAWLAYQLSILFTEKNKNTILPKIKRVETLMKKYKLKTAHLKKYLNPILSKQKNFVSAKKTSEIDSASHLVSQNTPPEKITLTKPEKTEEAKEEDNRTNLLWGLLPVIIALIYIAYRNNKYRKQ